MIDGFLTFYHSGIDARIALIVLAAVMVENLAPLRHATGFDDFISRLARALEMIVLVAGLGLLTLASLRFASDLVGFTQWSARNQTQVHVGMGIAALVTAFPLILKRLLQRQEQALDQRSRPETVILLPAPETTPPNKGTAP